MGRAFLNYRSFFKSRSVCPCPIHCPTSLCFIIWVYDLFFLITAFRHFISNCKHPFFTEFCSFLFDLLSALFLELLNSFGIDKHSEQLANSTEHEHDSYSPTQLNVFLWSELILSQWINKHQDNCNEVNQF